MTGQNHRLIAQQRAMALRTEAEKRRLASSARQSNTSAGNPRLITRTVLCHRPIFRAAALCVIACALLGATFSSTALATSRVTAARAQGLYYASFRHEAPTIDKVSAAQAQGSYYASFGHEEPLAPPPSPSSGTPWVLLVTGLAIALLVAVTVEVRRRGGLGGQAATHRRALPDTPAIKRRC